MIVACYGLMVIGLLAVSSWLNAVVGLVSLDHDGLVPVAYSLVMVGVARGECL